MNDSPIQVERVGRTIDGRYIVEDLLGRGGMGAVYRVRDQKTGARVALKRGVARDRSKVRKRQALLEREYHTLVQLAHPRIIEVFDYGIDEHGAYYTMELLDGADLDRAGRVPWKEASALLLDVASSLAILHARGLIHRDVSSRNVRRTADGHVKLIDFGAMASMGATKEVVGTPPFMAPEVLQMQALDARADLFSLGALAYYLLSGRHAYPARRLKELRDVWRSSPQPIARLVPEVPQALSALVVQLIALDRGARPLSAAEVMKRFAAIAGLPTEEHLEVSRAYLATPTLVGREKQLLAIRKGMLSLVRGDGGLLLVEGAAGSGRSRMLDACALEGKLLGASVVRVDLSDSASGDWGVARAIGTQLLELMPKEALEAARLSRDVLGHLLEGLMEESGSVSAAAPDRSLLIRELRDFVLGCARSQRLLLVVDDADRIDEPSAALIAALAQKAERKPLMLALALDTEGNSAASPSLRVLRSLSTPIELSFLLPEETESLVRSVFGAVPNLALVAGKIHAAAHGSPRTIMELAQHLVSRGLARYDAGSWSLPAQLDEGDLPDSLSASLAARLSALGDDARELVEVLCLADGDPLAFSSYGSLTSHREPKRLFAALDELVAARVLVADAERYRFSQRGFLAVLQETMSPARRPLLHGRIADLLTRDGGDVLRRAHHLLFANRDIEAIELLTSINLQARLPPLPLLERAVECAEQQRLPARTIHQLRMAVLGKASLLLAPQSFRRCMPQVLAQLEQDSGLARYRELSDLPPGERLSQALNQTQQRYLATPERDRVYAVVDAVRELGRFIGASGAMAAPVHDLQLAESLPSIEPLSPLSPAIGVVSRLIEGSKEWIRGRSLRGKAIHEQMLARISEADHGGLDEAQYDRTRLMLTCTLGLFEATMGVEACERYAEVLEGDRELRVNAWQVRMQLHLAQGDHEAARKCERRAELLQLQEGIQQRYVGMNAGFQLRSCAALGDLIGLKNAIDVIASLAKDHPGWRPHVLYGQSRYRELQGDLQGALDTLMPAFELAQPAKHLMYGYLAAAQVNLLRELGRVDEALERGLACLAICEREELTTINHEIQVAVALSLARVGRFEEAITIMDSVVERGRKLGQSGLALGVLYEARARIAIWMNDGPNFERFVELCASEYNKGRSPALGVKFARLMEDARGTALGPSEPSAESQELIAASQTESEYETIHSRMDECVDPGDRARCALTLLLQSVETFVGYLYGVAEDKVSVLAWIPDVAPEKELGEWVHAYVQSELALFADMTATGDQDEEPTPDVPRRFTDADGRRFEPILLIGSKDGEQRIAAVLVALVHPGPRTPLDRGLIFELASELLAHDDVTGISVDEDAGKSQ